MVNGHGDDIYKYQCPVKVNFSSNVYHGINIAALDDFLSTVIPVIHSYPEPDAASLAKLLAQDDGLDSANLLITNGAAEGIYLIAQAFRGKSACIYVPTFSEYEDACKVNDIHLTYITSLDQLPADTDMLWLCNPNNPTGEWIDELALAELVKCRPDITFVFDRSYSYFVDKPVMNNQFWTEFKNVILIHSLTKRYAVPGLRIGYMVGCSEIIARVAFFRIPWTLNALALEAGKFILQHKDLFTFNLQAYLNTCRLFREQLAQIPFIEVRNTDAHFFLCHLKEGTASQLKVYLIENFGILIRDAGNFRGLDATYFRLATQSESENQMLIKAILSWKQSL